MILYRLEELMPTGQHEVRLLLESGPKDYTCKLERKVGCRGTSLWRIVCPDAPSADPRSGASACWYHSVEKAQESWERRLAQARLWGLAPVGVPA